MNPLQPLMALLTQTERERDEAVAAHNRAVAQHQAAIAQSEQLVAYRREYEQRWATNFKQSSHIELMHCYHAFTQRLALAVAHQKRTEEFAEGQLASTKAMVQAAELRVASVQKLIERRLNEQRLRAERQEQKATDEFAARIHWKPSTHSPNTTY